jgi:hypothetical protein
VKLYHGSDVEVTEPRIITSEVGRDFGFGFYTTDIEGQAIRWAKRKQKIALRRGNPNAKALVSVFEFDESAYENVNIKQFGEVPGIEWLDLVCLCRSNITYKHNYDIVIGKIANDSVGETVSYVMAGIMRKEDALEKLKFEQINNQVCFCTEAALKYIKFIKTEEV